MVRRDFFLHYKGTNSCFYGLKGHFEKIERSSGKHFLASRFNMQSQLFNSHPNCHSPTITLYSIMMAMKSMKTPSASRFKENQ